MSKNNAIGTNNNNNNINSKEPSELNNSEGSAPHSVSSTSCASLSDLLENGLEGLGGPGRGPGGGGGGGVRGVRDGGGGGQMDERGPSLSSRAHTKRTPKAKRIRFYHNGNRFFAGVVVPVGPERYRSFDSLLVDLTAIMARLVTLPSGVRAVYSVDGKKIGGLEELNEGVEYVCGGKGEQFKRIEYAKIAQMIKTKKTPPANKIAVRIITHECVRPRIITLIRNGIKPRKIVRLLLNKRNSSSLEQILSALTDVAQLDSGAVRKVFTLSGHAVTALPQFFAADDVFFVYGNERFTQDDFELEFEESKSIQQYKKPPSTTLRPSIMMNGGLMRKMPKKDVKNTLLLNETNNADADEYILKKLSEDDNIQLPATMRQRFTVGRMIGDGNFAVVRLCHETGTNRMYALKIIDKSKCKGKEDMIENEVKILKMVQHPNIISLVAQQFTKTLLYLVCEYVPGGDLFDAITVAQRFDEEQTALMINHLASAIAYLHNLNIVHRDIKPENLLVEFEGDAIKVLKLGDFGLACEVTEPLFTVCGTPTYVAPEILHESGYGVKIDVWAAGVILYILLSGYPPFVSPDNDQEKLFDCILAGEYDFPDECWADISHSAKELIQHMLQLAPDLRFSAEDVLDHPWLQKGTINQFSTPN